MATLSDLVDHFATGVGSKLEELRTKMGGNLPEGLENATESHLGSLRESAPYFPDVPIYDQMLEIDPKHALGILSKFYGAIIDRVGTSLETAETLQSEDAYVEVIGLTNLVQDLKVIPSIQALSFVAGVLYDDTATSSDCDAKVEAYVRYLDFLDDSDDATAPRS